MKDIDAQIAEAEAEYSRAWRAWMEASERKREADVRRKELRSEKRSREREAAREVSLRRADVMLEMRKAGRTEEEVADHFAITVDRLRYDLRQADHYRRWISWEAEEAKLNSLDTNDDPE